MVKGNVLVVNAGSATVKVKLFRGGGLLLATGMRDAAGPGGRSLHLTLFDGEGRGRRVSATVDGDGVRPCLESLRRLLEAESIAGIGCVGHRVVHGGEDFRQPVSIDDDVLEAIREKIPLAPLHNPANIEGIEACRDLFPSAQQVAVFDTAFHQSLSPEAFLYAVPRRFYEEDGVRRYGFHGISHAYVAGEAARLLARSPGELNLITLHLGNGASMAAVAGGRCIDTTMGLSPLEGLVMGSRCGDVDPSLPRFLAERRRLSPAEVDDVLNGESGLKGLCGSSDMREVLRRCEAGDGQAVTALAVYCRRVRKYIGAFTALLGRTDALVFTGGVGENAAPVRSLCCEGLEGFGIHVDPALNGRTRRVPRCISADGSRVAILVIPTDEELAIAREAVRLLEGTSC